MNYTELPRRGSPLARSWKHSGTKWARGQALRYHWYRYQSGKAGHLAPISLNRIFNPVPLSAHGVVYCLTRVQSDCTIRGTLVHDKLAIYLPVHGFTCTRAPFNHFHGDLELSYLRLYSRGSLLASQRAQLVGAITSSRSKGSNVMALRNRGPWKAGSAGACIWGSLGLWSSEAIGI